MNSIYKKLFLVQSQMSGLVKEKQGHNYRYADIASVYKELKPLLNQQKILLLTTLQTTTNEGVTKLELRNLLTDTETEDGETVLSVCEWDVTGMTMQAVGSVRTYLHRYALVTMFNIPIVDDDGDLASFIPAERSEKLTALAESLNTALHAAFEAEDEQLWLSASELWHGITASERKQVLKIVDASTKKLIQSAYFQSLGGKNGTEK